MELNEILTSARNMLKARTDSLRNDVARCLSEDKDTQPAPFPALLYCFSTIDLLGALYNGNAEEKAPATEQSKNYMTKIMRYPEDRVFLLQKVFRHKLVHLAQPNPIISIDNSKITNSILENNIKSGLYIWAVRHEERNLHLKIIPVVDDKQDKYLFYVSIQSLVEDIVDSVYKPNGYLHRLEKDEEDLPAKFDKAYHQIFEHEPLI